MSRFFPRAIIPPTGNLNNVRIFRQISGDSSPTGTRQKLHDDSHLAIEHFLHSDINLSKETARVISNYLASKYSYTIQQIEAELHDNPSTFIKYVADYCHAEHEGLLSVHGPNLPLIRADLFDIVKKMIEPTPEVSALFFKDSKRVPTAKNFAAALDAYMTDAESTYLPIPRLK